MKENADKLLEHVVEKAMKSSTLESPSRDFTQMVMSQVGSKSSVLVYQPLISKTGWILIFASIAAFVVFLYMISGVEANHWFPAIDFSLISNIDFSKLIGDLELTQITSYAIIVCGIMLCAQIPILKYFIDKRQRNFS